MIIFFIVQCLLILLLLFLVATMENNKSKITRFRFRIVMVTWKIPTEPYDPYCRIRILRAFNLPNVKEALEVYLPILLTSNTGLSEVQVRGCETH